MKCPKCGLINLDSALRCDCGYDFREGQIAEDDQTARSTRSRPTGISPSTVAVAVFILVVGFIVINPIGLLLNSQAVMEMATGRNAGITMVNYERLQTGMTYAQACEILGKSGTEISRGEIVGLVTVMYQWQGDGMANMNAMFQNDKLISKAQFGLK